MNIMHFISKILLPPLLDGAGVTLRLIVFAIPFGYICGVFLAVGRVYGNRLVSFFCTLYTLFFRGTPLLVQLFILYYGLPSVNIFLSPFAAAIIGFILCSGAYHSEYIRGSIQSIKSGQMMAAEALGMTKFTAILSIILPQALRRSIPGCSNEIIYLVKYSSLAFMVTCVELTGAGKIIASRYFEYTLVFLVVGALYLFMVSVITKILHSLEKKLEIPGIG
ncbi:MAG: amino acid ABC transporter permease [Atribacterota bacterium]|nr:amino acid ABC transporter permease [Atribacterota bacterium]MDD4895848.1 amino acid ABC transporter permease [Atribacterota bacterium]MDD5636701.1 amino acid ABC transporter permease [Atribacterota bacterium]